ncbi:MAG TPA: tetratricopeptide repeat protein [Acidobacteriaceae bacterium]|nr:tetratricopeptide repeat protein [Acidobacteriaceae bacterium]
MDTRTRHALKQDKFVTATTSGLEWVGENRTRVIVWAVSAVVAIGLIITGIIIYQQRSAAANQLLGQALDVYETPLAQPNQPAEPGVKTYASSQERARDAYPLFREVADRYGWLRSGEMAEYFAGEARLDLGQQSAAEADLQKASRAHDGNLSSLAKMALANLYAQTGRTSQAVGEFQDVIAHPATTVPKSEAQLQLAQLYETTQPNEAKRLYAEIKDENPNTDAAQIASQKLQTLK